MGKSLLILVIAVLMLLTICYIVRLILAKNPKDVNVKFGLKGFEMKTSFFEDQNV